MKKNILLSLLSACILWLAWPPTPYVSLLLLVAFVPLLVAVHRVQVSAKAKKGKAVFLLALLTCFLWNTASIYWVFNSLNAVMPTAIACILALIPFGLAALLMALCFVLYHKTRAITKPIMADILLIGFWVCYEYLHQSWDLKFPWMTLGNGFASNHQWVQWYSYTGVYGGTLWVWVSNILVFRFYKLLPNKTITAKNIKQKLIIVWVLWLAIPIGTSLLMYHNYSEEINPSNVIIVQPNINPYLKYGGLTAQQQLDTLITLSQQKAKKNTEFFIWPETALTGLTHEQDFRNTANYSTVKTFLKPFKNATLITGAETFLTYTGPQTPSATYDKNNKVYYDTFNAAVAIENSEKLQFYHKSKLVPGVEKMPFTTVLYFLKPVFEKFGGTTGGYGYQQSPNNLYSQSGIAASPVICYESIWGNWVAQYIQQGGQFIAIITNDAWWGNTPGKNQHLEYAKLRAIENRRWVVRSANTGISATVNQRGDIVQQSQWWQPAAINQTINLNTTLTFYTQYPDVLVYPFILMGILGVLYLLYQKFKK
ncbi:MAG: apolipoprotein N-acyltransferase [Sphingobacteriales bacterium]|nr:MAG: apolipoprotein N-acyltransferase [Sphingobacteriales bacterium]TAF82704.1 MAG: apolipoprotein N-acyltransferase [Sphingobacteriales bacterium]